MQASPPGVECERRLDVLEVRVDLPSRRRRAAVFAAAFASVSLVLYASVAAPRGPKEASFVAATAALALAVAFVRRAVLGLTPVRIIVDAEGVSVVGPRPWARGNVRLAHGSIRAVEPMPNGVGLRGPAASVTVLVEDLSAEQASFLESVLSDAIDGSRPQNRTA